MRTATYPGLHLAHLGHLEKEGFLGDVHPEFSSVGAHMLVLQCEWTSFLDTAKLFWCSSILTSGFVWSRLVSPGLGFKCTFAASRAPTSQNSCPGADSHSCSWSPTSEDQEPGSPPALAPIAQTNAFSSQKAGHLHTRWKLHATLVTHAVVDTSFTSSTSN
jgi:hypothetical protein